MVEHRGRAHEPAGEQYHVRCFLLADMHELIYIEHVEARHTSATQYPLKNLPREPLHFQGWWGTQAGCAQHFWVLDRCALGGSAGEWSGCDPSCWVIRFDMEHGMDFFTSSHK